MPDVIAVVDHCIEARSLWATNELNVARCLATLTVAHGQALGVTLPEPSSRSTARALCEAGSWSFKVTKGELS